jgi:hypothetical protein
MSKSEQDWEQEAEKQKERAELAEAKLELIRITASAMVTSFPSSLDEAQELFRSMCHREAVEAREALGHVGASENIKIYPGSEEKTDGYRRGAEAAQKALDKAFDKAFPKPAPCERVETKTPFRGSRVCWVWFAGDDPSRDPGVTLEASSPAELLEAVLSQELGWTIQMIRVCGGGHDVVAEDILPGERAEVLGVLFGI